MEATNCFYKASWEGGEYTDFQEALEKLFVAHMGLRTAAKHHIKRVQGNL
jgi:hypothetical protein